MQPDSLAVSIEVEVQIPGRMENCF